MSLPKLHSVEDVADALQVTPSYVRQQCRRRVWPHRRLARGQVAFTVEDVAAVLDLTASPVSHDEPTGLAFAPRSRRTA